MAKTVMDLSDFSPIFIRYDVIPAVTERDAAGLGTDPALEAIAAGVVEGDEAAVGAAAQTAIATRGPQAVVDTLIAGMREVNRLWDDGVYFLPQVIRASDALMAGLTHAEATLGSAAKKKGMVAMHCAPSDIHDIGKSIAAALIRANGYGVVDVGSDVPADRVVESVVDDKPDLVTDTALETTTMSAFAEISILLRAEGLILPLVCGGGAASEECPTSFPLGVCAGQAKDGPFMNEDASPGMSWEDMRAKWNLVV